MLKIGHQQGFHAVLLICVHFFARGCKALGSTCSTTRWPATGLDLHELYAEFGDDLDGLAGDLEDLFGG